MTSLELYPKSGISQWLFILMQVEPPDNVFFDEEDDDEEIVCVVCNLGAKGAMERFIKLLT